MISAPWSHFARAFCLPNNCGCEYVDLNAWIAQPSAFWTSLFYLFFAFYLYLKTNPKSQRLKLWTFSLVLLGLSSHFAHGSYLEFAISMDFGGIILVTSFFPLHRWISKRIANTLGQMVIIFLYQAALWFVFYSLNKWFKFTLCILVFSIAFFEIYKSEGKSFIKAKQLHMATTVLLLSFIVFMFDELKFFCDPQSWLNGHSIWHFGTALGLYLYGKWRFRAI